MKILLGGNVDCIHEVSLYKFKCGILEVHIGTKYKYPSIFKNTTCPTKLYNRIKKEIKSIGLDVINTSFYVIGIGAESSLDDDKSNGYVALIAENEFENQNLENCEYFLIDDSYVLCLMLTDDIYDGRRVSKIVRNKKYFPECEEEVNF